MSNGKLNSFFEEREELLFIAKLFFFIFVIYNVKDFIFRNMFFFILFSPLIFTSYIRYVANQKGQGFYRTLFSYLSFVPIAYSEKDTRYNDVAYVTYCLVLINVIIYYGISENISLDILCNNFCFFPDEPSLWNVPVSLITAFFLHAGQGHLWGNMIFLWAVGSVVEKRVGWKTFLILYFFMGIFAGLFSFAIGYISYSSVIPSLGASGAIAGVMGIYAVRCYFKTMYFPVPLLGFISLIFPVNVKVRFNALVLMGFFFLMDLSGFVKRLQGVDYSNVGYLAHIGGMFSGVILAFLLGFNKDAYRERHLDNASKIDEADMFNVKERRKSLDVVLAEDPDSAEAHLIKARDLTKSFAGDEGMEHYEQAISLYMKTDRDKSIEVFEEFFTKYNCSLKDKNLQFNFAKFYYMKKNVDYASRILEYIVNDEETDLLMKEKALYHMIVMLKELNLMEGAHSYLELFRNSFPQSQYIGKLDSVFQG